MGKKTLSRNGKLYVMDLYVDDAETIFRSGRENLIKIQVGIPYQYPTGAPPFVIVMCGFRTDMDICRVVSSSEGDLDNVSKALFGENFVGGRRYQVNPEHFEEDEYQNEFYSRRRNVSRN